MKKKKKDASSSRKCFPVNVLIGQEQSIGASCEGSARKHGWRPVQTGLCLVFYRRTRLGAGGPRPWLWVACVRANREQSRQVNRRPVVSNLLIPPQPALCFSRSNLSEPFIFRRSNCPPVPVTGLRHLAKVRRPSTRVTGLYNELRTPICKPPPHPTPSNATVPLSSPGQENPSH